MDPHASQDHHADSDSDINTNPLAHSKKSNPVSLAELIERVAKLSLTPLARRNHAWISADPLTHLKTPSETERPQLTKSIRRHLVSRGEVLEGISTDAIFSRFLGSIYSRSWAAAHLHGVITELRMKKELVVWRDLNNRSGQTSLFDRLIESLKLLRSEAGIADAFMGAYATNFKNFTSLFDDALDNPSEQKRKNSLVLTEEGANDLIQRIASKIQGQHLIESGKEDPQESTLPPPQPRTISAAVQIGRSDARHQNVIIQTIASILLENENYLEATRKDLRNHVIYRLNDMAMNGESYKAFRGKEKAAFLFLDKNRSPEALDIKKLGSRIDTALKAIAKGRSPAPGFMSEINRGKGKTKNSI